MIELRIMPESDYPAYHAICNTLEVTMMSGTLPKVVSYEFAIERERERRAAEKKDKSFVSRGIYVGDTLVGYASYFPRENGEKSIGYFIGKDFYGNGYATAAAKALVALLRSHGYTGLIHAGCFQDNPASCRVLEKAGFSYVGMGEGASRARGIESGLSMHCYVYSD